MALSLRDQGEINAAQASALGDEDFDFVVQIWTADGRSLLYGADGLSAHFAAFMDQVNQDRQAHENKNGLAGRDPNGGKATG